jgi:hypothetical protein
VTIIVSSQLKTVYEGIMKAFSRVRIALRIISI